MINLRNLKEEVAEAHLDFTDIYGATLFVEYRPGLLTPEREEAIGKSTVVDELLTFLCEFIVSWDLLGDDQEPIPLTIDNLRSIPSSFLMRVFVKLQQEMGPGEAKSGGSFSG